ncbi:MAG: helix-turn-helix domain-containing protein [Bacilli bacterium]|nr:helix-turn-helix domain-containing protein [Bacilli bacterium]
MKRRIYVYQPNLSTEIIELFSSLGSFFAIENQETDVLTILDTDFYNEDPLDYEAFRELIIEDFNDDVTIFVEPYTEGEFIDASLISSFIKKVPSGVIYFEEFITFVVVKNNVELQKAIIKYVSEKVNSEVIHTVREFINNNMNSSMTSKQLYMHRNTLNYRIDNFIDATNINVKTFKGANAIYLLYNF